ncbi:ATP-binding protein [Hominiventricola aquisgranensis]|uniref:histidine kinase n=1 Tax=Hominiventricola aquisgranensis TaxID=3133164 RepID=A0ABV1I111_9FIRM
MNVNTENEHILVCLSSSPSNKNIIFTASKMANALQAQFTALYVQTGARTRSEDKERLDENIRFAEELGAEIVMTHGENVPLQISEYAQLSNVTEIVIGQSSMKRNNFFSRKTLTEKLIDIVPDIDIHIIPDTVNAENYRKGHLPLHVEKPSVKECFLTVLIFVICTFIGLVFQKFHFSEANVVTIYILGVLLTSILTDGYLCSVAGSVISVFLFCFFLTEPRMSFQTYAVGYPVTFVIMLISSVLTGTLAAKLKTHARLSAQLAFRTQILFDTDRLLQKARSQKEILEITCTQLARLFDRSIVAYAAVNGRLAEGHLFSEKEKAEDQSYLTLDEQQIARWVYTNKKRAGATTHYYKNSKCLYLAIRIGDQVYGVVGVPAQKDVLDSFEYSILLSVLNECALAMDNARNAEEKEKNAVIAKNEQLRADLLRAISHDLRTPLCSISGNADMLLSNGKYLDEGTRRQIYTDIYDDAEWLTGVVENLLSITRLNDGRLKFKFTDQLMDEVIAEALRHISRKHDDYKIITECEDLLLTRMDVRLIIQVLVNLVDNAIKYTPSGSTITIRALKKNEKAWISVEDNGPGISDEIKPHIFEMFFTGGNNIADSQRSLGLGLALCQSIVEAHGGKMELEDNDPHGCIFSFALPLSEVILNE